MDCAQPVGPAALLSRTLDFFLNENTFVFPSKRFFKYLIVEVKYEYDVCGGGQHDVGGGYEKHQLARLELAGGQPGEDPET